MGGIEMKGEWKETTMAENSYVVGEAVKGMTWPSKEKPGFYHWLALDKYGYESGYARSLAAAKTRVETETRTKASPPIEP